MLEGKALTAALEEIDPAAFHGIVFRCVSLRALLGLKNDAGRLVITRPNSDFLYAGGPVKLGGRFTPKGGAPSLYTGETENTARLEKRQAAFGTVRKKQHGIEVAYALGATLRAVPDLTNSAVVDRLETSRNEIIEPWRYRPDGTTPPTHVLGVAVVGSKRFSAIRYPSAANPRGRCIVVFSELIQSGETIALIDQDSIFNQIMRLAAS
jgi:RES domain-containing protein